MKGHVGNTMEEVLCLGRTAPELRTFKSGKASWPWVVKDECQNSQLPPGGPRTLVAPGKHPCSLSQAQVTQWLCSFPCQALFGTAHALEEGTLAQCWFLNLFTTSLQGS